MSGIIGFRKPTILDTAVMFAWQQHPKTRESNPRHKYPRWETYLNTVAECAADSNEMLMLLCIDAHPVGFIVFFDKSPDTGFGYRVAPGMEDRGFEATMVEYAKQRFGSRLITQAGNEKEAEELTLMGFTQEGAGNLWRYRG